MLYLGIDPGVSGGLAVLDEDGRPVAVTKMPDTEADILAWIFEAIKSDDARRGMLERVWSSPGWGHAGAFTFGKNYGALRMAFTAARIPFEEVMPKRWQATLGCASGKDKNITKRRAQSLFPTTTVTHAIADALLLAEYCRRLHAGSVHRTSAQGPTNGKAQITDQGNGARQEGRRRKEGGSQSRAARRAPEGRTSSGDGHPQKPEARSDLRVARTGPHAAQRR